MPAFIFYYATMNAGKSTALLQTAHNYRERGLEVMLLTAAIDKRAGADTIGSRIGLRAPAQTFTAKDDLFQRVAGRLREGALHRVLVDEAQFLEDEQVWQLARACDELAVAVTCYGLRTDFRGELFPGSATLLAIADELRPLHSVCRCGRNAAMVVRHGANGRVETAGAQVMVGGNETYESLCRRHWREAMRAEDDRSSPPDDVKG